MPNAGHAPGLNIEKETCIVTKTQSLKGIHPSHSLPLIRFRITGKLESILNRRNWDTFTFRVKEGATERQDMKTEAGRHRMEGGNAQIETQWGKKEPTNVTKFIRKWMSESLNNHIIRVSLNCHVIMAVGFVRFSHPARISWLGNDSLSPWMSYKKWLGWEKSA